MSVPATIPNIAAKAALLSRTAITREVQTYVSDKFEGTFSNIDVHVSTELISDLFDVHVYIEHPKDYPVAEYVKATEQARSLAREIESEFETVGLTVQLRLRFSMEITHKQRA